MTKGRLEAFSDGVLAIIITIMVLELKVPHGGDFNDLLPLLPVFGSYVLSFIYIAIYWNNHHHFFQAVSHVNGNILWSNMNLLFWLSLIPFASGWMGENYFSMASVTVYGIVLLMAGIAYRILQHYILKSHGKDSLLAIAIGKDTKGKLSVILYIIGIAIAFLNVWLSFSIYILVAVLWLIPDSRIEKALTENK